MKTRPSFLQLTKKFLKSQQGFSLAEVMVAAGMLGVLSLGVTQLMQNSKKTEKRFGQQMNLYALDEEIREALENTTACGRTFRASDIISPSGGPVSQPAALNTASWTALPNSIIYGGVNSAAENNVAQWNTLLREWDAGTPGAGVYGNGSNRVSVLSIRYRAFLNQASLQAAAYEGATYGNNAAYKSPIPGSAPAESYAKLVVRITFTRGNYDQFVGLANDAARQERSSQLVSGPFKVSKFYEVNVRINAANQVQSCYADANQITKAYCNSLGGTFDDALAGGRCTQIQVHDSPNDGTQFSITATNESGGSASMLAQGGLQVGGNRGDAPPTGGDILAIGDVRGNRTLNVGSAAQITGATQSTSVGDTTIGADLRVNSSLRVGTDAQISAASVANGDGTFGRDLKALRALNVGSPLTPATAIGGATIAQNLLTEGTSTTLLGHHARLYSHVGTPASPLVGTGDLTVQNTTRSRIFHINSSTPGDNATFGQTSVDASHRLRVSAGSAYFTTTGNSEVMLNNSANGSQLHLNPTSADALRINSGTGIRGLTISPTGRIAVGTTASPKIIIGEGSGVYRPILINFQDASATAATGVVGTEAATKAWVKNMIYGNAFSEAQISSIVANITDYAQHHTELVIQQNMCNTMRTRTFTSGHAYRACVWVGAPTNQCRCDIAQMEANCSDDALADGTRVCNDIFLSNRLNALGTITSGSQITGQTIHSNDWMRAQRLYTQVGGVSLPPAGYIRGQYVESTVDTLSNRDVLATRDLIAGRGGSESRVCSRSGGSRYCYTKFGKFTCQGGANMIGIAHGHPICARAGALATDGAVGAQRWLED